MWHWDWSEFWRGTAVGTCGLVLCICLEAWAPVERYTLKQRLPGVVMQYFGGWVGLALIWPLQQLWTDVGVKPYMVPLWSVLHPLRWWGYLIEIVIVLMVWDFLRYWRHRAEHKWFWPIHVVHHAPDELHAANSIGHPLQGFIELAMVTIPMSFVKFSGPSVPAIAWSISGVLALYIHCPTKLHLGPLWRFLVDPRFHRIHHSLEPRHFNKNFSVCFSLWDAMFRTAYWPTKGEWPAVGVKEYPAPRTFWQYLVLPLANLPNKNIRKVIGNASGEAGVDAQPVRRLRVRVPRIDRDVLLSGQRKTPLDETSDFPVRRRPLG